MDDDKRRFKPKSAGRNDRECSLRAKAVDEAIRAVETGKSERAQPEGKRTVSPLRGEKYIEADKTRTRKSRATKAARKAWESANPSKPEPTEFTPEKRVLARLAIDGAHVGCSWLANSNGFCHKCRKSFK